MDTMQNIDSQGNIDKAYYKNVIYDLCERFLSELFPNETKYTNNHLLAVMSHIYDSLFKPDTTLINNQKCNIPYNAHNIQTLFDIYSQLYNDHLCLPSMYSFSKMTGLSEDAINSYLTAARSEITRNRKELIQGKLYNSPLGVTVLANNDIESGLMYNRQNIVDHETVKQGLTLNDFVKISQKE